jgi:Ecdysteroid kinase-like family
MSPTFPIQPSELTATWLTEQLQNAGVLDGAVVTDVSLTPIGEGVGMLGVLTRVELTYDRVAPRAPTSVVAKFATTNEANRAVAMHFRVYEREARFLRVMEDLSGYEMGDQVQGCTAALARTVLDAVAPVHARFWGAVDDPIVGFVPRVDGDTQIAGISGGCEAGWGPCVERFGAVIDDGIKAEGHRFVPAVPELHRMMGRRDQTVIHGDMRLDNLMFGRRDQQRPLVLLDWQGILVSSGAQDLAYLLTQNVTIDERRAHESEVVEHYHRRLVEHGVTGYQLEKLWDDYRLATLYMFAYAVVIAGTLDPSNERGARFMEQLIHRASAAVTDHDLLAMLP